MSQKYLIAITATLLFSASALAQNGANAGMGGPDGDYASLYELVSGYEKKCDSFNVFLNTGGSFNADENGGAFSGRDLRLEIKGNLGNHLGYRLRYQLTKSSMPLPLDKYPTALDIFIVSWKFNEHFTAQAGKIFQAWGGFEYDANPIYIYKFTDFTGATDPFTAGAALSWFPNHNHEIQFSVTDTHTVPVDMRYPAALGVQAAKLPLTYVLNWNGTLFNGLVCTRWAAGTMVFAQGERADRITLGTRLNLPKLTWYTDLIGSWETIDYTGFGLSELGTLEKNVRYFTGVTKADWRFAPMWNLGLQASLEWMDSRTTPDIRKRWGALAAIEFYPDPSQDFRMFLTGYLDGCRWQGQNGPEPWIRKSVELGFIYRIKAF